MKSVINFLSIPVILIVAGCGTSNPDAAKYAHLTAMAYYNQPSNTEILNYRTKGDGKITISLSGDAEVTMNAPIPPKQIMPRDPSVLVKAIEGITKLGIGYFVADAFSGAMETRVVQQPAAPAPLVVRPEVITVPSP